MAVGDPVVIRTSFLRGTTVEVKAETTYTGDGWREYGPITVGANSTVQADIQMDVSALKAFAFLSDVTVSLKTNSSGSPDATVPITGGTPNIWPASVGQTNPLGSTDVTTVYLTNATAGAATVTLYVLADATP